jgi:hypothetical protein
MEDLSFFDHPFDNSYTSKKHIQGILDFCKSIPIFSLLVNIRDFLNIEM